MKRREPRKCVCPTCGKAFETKVLTQVYCSFKCARAKGNGIKTEMVQLTCPTCLKQFDLPKSDHRIGEGQQTLYCSRECYKEWYRKKNKKACPICGNEFIAKRASQKVCSTECGRKYKSKNTEHKAYMENGYIVEYQNGYNKKGNVKQHRRIMEEHLGRKLKPYEVVHHINGIKTDNRIENLQLMTASEHSSLHRLEEKANGKPLFGRCTN